MAWEKRGDRKYFYRCVRQGGQVKKLYYGNGPTGTFAANIDALRQAERKAAEVYLRVEKDQLDVALALTQKLNRAGDLVAAATLLAAGFHRPGRHKWRKWRDGRKILKCGSD